MTRQYNTIFYNTVQCEKIQIHLLHNSNTIKVIKKTASLISSAGSPTEISNSQCNLMLSSDLQKLSKQSFITPLFNLLIFENR